MNSEPIKSVLAISVGFLFVYYLTDDQWAILISLLIGLSGLLSNYLARQIDFWWMKLGYVLGLIVPKILLSIIFYCILTPTAILSKLFGEKNQLNLKNSSKSLFKEPNKTFDQSSFEKQW